MEGSSDQQEKESRHARRYSARQVAKQEANEADSRFGSEIELEKYPN